MEISINVACTNCGKCLRVCPAGVFQKQDNQTIVAASDFCIGCGHCIMVCPVAAVQHEDFPVEKVHPFERSSYPSPEQTMALILGRRSNRAFAKTPIPNEYLQQIVEAAYRAPTASNLQGLSFTLITQPESLKKVSQFTIDVFGSIVNMLDNPLGRIFCKNCAPTLYKYFLTFKRMKKEYQEGNDGILRGATALLLIHTNKGSRFGSEDSNLACQNATLMAESLGVSQFYTGFVLNASKRKKGKLEKLLNINGQIHAGLALAMPAFHPHSYVDKKEISLEWI